MLGLFLMTYRWPFAPVTCKAFQAWQVTDADEAVEPAAPARVTQAAAAVITVSSFLADRPTGRYMMSTSFLRVWATTVTALVPVTLMLPKTFCALRGLAKHVRPKRSPECVGYGDFVPVPI